MGDTAIAVNPKDDRYKSLIENVVIPIVNRTIKIIADNYADPEQGSGSKNRLLMILTIMMLG